MPTFADLIKEYTSRTGVSDAELARTLGVGRQTIFRWKEGLVLRPRHRRDVLRAAARLRLTPEERDGLLLAAGFAPESASIHEPPSPADVDAPLTAPAADERDATRDLRQRRRLAGLAALAILGAIGVSIRATWPDVPRPRSGERLIVLGGEDPADPQATPAAGMVRLAESLRREIAANRLTGLRVAWWPSARPDEDAMIKAQRSSSAVAVVVVSDTTDVWVQFEAQPASIVGRVGHLDALVRVPAHLRVAIDAGREGDVAAFGHLLLGRAMAQAGRWDDARAFLTQAQARLPAASVTQTALSGLLAFEAGLIDHLAVPADRQRALASYSAALSFPHAMREAHVNRAIVSLQLGITDTWQADVDAILQQTPTDLAALAARCWGKLLGERPADALAACDYAIGDGALVSAHGRDSTDRVQDARGMVLSLLGRREEAIQAFEGFLVWVRTQPQAVRERYEAERGAWLEALRAGGQPVDEAALARVRGEG